MSRTPDTPTGNRLHQLDIRSESTPKSILKRTLRNDASHTKVLFSPTKEVKNFKDYFDSTDELDQTSLGTGLSAESIQSAERSMEHNNEIITKLLTDINIPYVLSLYVQLFFNTAIVGFVMYLLYIFVSTIKSDVNNKIDMYVSDALQEISSCSIEYFRNKCNLDVIPPLLVAQCTRWLQCMNRNPQLIGKSKITAETFADIFNGFLRPLSWKSLFCIVSLILGSLLVTNITFSNYRSSTKVKISQLENTVRSQANLISNLQIENQKQSDRSDKNFLAALSADDLTTNSPLRQRSSGYAATPNE